MTRYLRTRDKIESYHTGHWERVFFGGFSEGNQAGALYEVHTSDYIGRPVQDSPFATAGVDRTGCPSASYYAPGGYGHDYISVSDWIPERLVTDFGTDHALGSFPDAFQKATTTLERTNPSRPTVSLGTYIQDLVELPRMLWNIGTNIKGLREAPTLPPLKSNLKGSANGYLGLKFGWAPLFDDISTLLSVTTYIEKRNAELHRLFEGKGIRSKIDFGTQRNEYTDTQYLSSGSPFGSVTSSQRTVRTTDHHWCTVRWKPTTAPGWHPSDAEYMALAKKVVSGASASGAFASAWDLIPWTWLLGWVINVRSFVLANGNTVPATNSPISIMKSADTVQSFVINRPDVGLTNATIKNWNKSRQIYPGATFGASLPYLGADRLSVLGALTVQRLR